MAKKAGKKSKPSRPGKPSAKPATKSAPKPATKAKTVKKVPVKAGKPEPKKVDSKKVDVKKVEAKPVPGKKPVATPSPTSQPQRPMRKPRPPAVPVQMPTGLGRLFDPRNPHRKPLIPSGPKATAQRALGQHGGPDSDNPKQQAKSPLDKRQLDHFRALLLKKRAELAGDVQTMENEALRGESGSLSNMPSHIAEQGSDASEQSLSLDLAAADRKLIREIDDALRRIAAGTFGICEHSGKPIKLERLEELPWARYSIESAREIERLAMRG